VIKEARWSGWVWVGECFFWYRPTRVVPDQRPLNGRCCLLLLLMRNICAQRCYLFGPSLSTLYSLVLQILVLQFPVLTSNPSFSSLAFSSLHFPPGPLVPHFPTCIYRPWSHLVLHFPVLHFQSPWYDINIIKCRCTRSSAIAEWPRDSSCQLKSCQLPRNSAETTCTTSLEQIEVIKLKRYKAMCKKHVHSTMTWSSHFCCPVVS